MIGFWNAMSQRAGNRFYALSAATLLAYALLAWFCAHTPYISDDYVFSRGTEQPFAEIMAGAPVRPQGAASAADVFRRPLQMYDTWDGRIGIYLIFGGVLALPGWVYTALTPLLILGAAFGLLLHVYGTSWKEELTASRLLLALGLLAVGLPSFGDIYFWRTGIGYAASLLGALVFLLPYRLRLETGRDRPHHPAMVAAFALLGLFVGCIEFLTPILCALLSVAACAYFYQSGRKQEGGGRRARQRPALYVAGAAGVCLGCLIVFLAPGNARRVLLRTPEFLQLDLADKITAFLLRLPEVQMLFWLPYLILGWSLYVLGRRGKQTLWRETPALTWISLAAAALGQGAYLFAPAPPPRAYTVIAVFLLIGALSAARRAMRLRPVPQADACFSFRLARIARLFFVVWCLALIPREMLLFQAADAACRERDALYAQSSGKAVCVPPLPLRGDRYMVLGSYQQDIEYDPNFWINQAVAACRGLKSVALCPGPQRCLGVAAVAGSPRQSPLTGRQYWDRLDLRLLLPPDQARPARAYVYYFGNPGLARRLPQSWADGLARWLGQGEAGSARQWLIPVFFARAEARLTWTKSADGRNLGRGSAKLWGLYPQVAPLYLVRPGASAASFDLLPLRDMADCTTPQAGAERAHP